MNLQIKEAAALELLRVGKTQTEISKQLGISLHYVSDIVKKLVKMSAVNKIANGYYTVLIETYEIKEEVPEENKGMQIVNVSLKHEMFIRMNYKIMPRSKLAKELKVNKLTLNFMLLQLGVGKL